MNEHDEADMGEIIPAGQLQALMRAEIDTQIATAKAYPRSLKTFKQRALDMATLDEETASSCMYALPRGGKTIQGPSVRLAEIVASAWGNLRYGARIVNDDGKIVTAQGVCHDLETNVSSTIETGRRVTDKRGKRYNDDMIVMTQNAAASVAIRNAIFKVIPMAYVREIYQKARLVAIGKAETLASRRAAAIEYFTKIGISNERILNVLGKPSIEDIGLDELAVLKGTASAIKNGEISVDDAFPGPAKPGTNGTPSRTDELKSKLAGDNGTNGTTPAEPPPSDGKPIDMAILANWEESVAEAVDFDQIDRLDVEFKNVTPETAGTATHAAIAKLLSDKRALLTEARSGKARRQAAAK